VAPVPPGAHAPPTHEPLPHTVPHAPQLLESLVGSEHVPLQQLLPPGQAFAHEPQWLVLEFKSMQVLLQQAGLRPLHAAKHVPQLLTFEVVSTQVPPQFVRVPHPQEPLMHCCPPHEELHDPQLFGSVSSLTQLPLHLLKPLAQVKPQTPLVQVAKALAGTWQQVTLLPFLHKSVVLGQLMQTV
jgi:hypothetical protein